MSRNVSFPYPPRKFIPLNCFDGPSGGQLEIPLNRHSVKSDCEIKPALSFVPINDENIESPSPFSETIFFFFFIAERVLINTGNDFKFLLFIFLNYP